MMFTWDPQKSEENFHKRGFDFAFATLIFDSVTLETEDRRGDYGETRIVAIGVANGFHLTVVYTDRIEADGRVVRRIISARRSNRRERSAFRDAVEG